MFESVRRLGHELRGGLYTKAVRKTTRIYATEWSSEGGKTLQARRPCVTWSARGEVIGLAEKGQRRLANSESTLC
jgi:hypothetical protein